MKLDQSDLVQQGVAKMKAQNYTYRTPFGDELAIITGKSAARGRDNLRNTRKALAAANDIISTLQADVKERHACTVRLRLRKNKEIASLLAEVASLKAENEALKDAAEMWQTIAKSSVTASGELLDALEND